MKTLHTYKAMPVDFDRDCMLSLPTEVFSDREALYRGLEAHRDEMVELFCTSEEMGEGSLFPDKTREGAIRDQYAQMIDDLEGRSDLFDHKYEIEDLGTLFLFGSMELDGGK